MWVTFATNNIGSRTHAARDNTQVVFFCTNGAFACDENILSKMNLLGDIIMVTVNGFFSDAKLTQFFFVMPLELTTSFLDDLHWHSLAPILQPRHSHQSAVCLR